MHVPFVNLKRTFLAQRSELEKALLEVAESGVYLFGSQAEAFKALFAQDLNQSVSKVVVCHSGTDALILSLLAANIAPGDEVITAANSAIPTASAIRAVGGIPIFSDVDPNTWVVTANTIEEKITPRTRAIIPVHLYGNMASMAEIRQMLKALGREDICLVEDIAQAQGAELAGRSAGTWGDFGAFSFFPTKNLGAMGDGGAVFCAREEDAEKIRALRHYGQRERNHAEITHGINSRLDEFQSAVLSIKIRDYRRQISLKQKYRKLYLEALGDLPLRIQEITPHCNPAWHVFVIATSSSAEREELRTYLKKQEVDTMIHYPLPLHRQKAFSSPASLPVAEKLASTILSLPLTAYHTESEISYVAESVKNFFMP